jgi:hypothetical protein
LFDAVWSALSVESTVTVGAGVLGAAVSAQLTVAISALVADATGNTSGIVAACESVLDRISTARLLEVLDVPVPGGTDSVQSTSTRCAAPVVPLITACG